MKAWFGGLSTKRKVLLILAVYFAGVIALAVLVPSQGKNNDFQPQNEFKLENWIHLKVGPLDMSINRAVLYLFLASGLTIFCMVWISRRMAMKPNKVQTTVELAYDLTRNNITGGNMDGKLAAKWFPFLSTLFFFIWFSNIIGYLPLPTNSAETFNVFGLAIPTFAIYAATANISIPLVLAAVVFVAYTFEGIRAKGPVGYLKSLIPAGVTGAMAGFLFVLELFSNVMRLMSLSVRLFANILAGHLIILFMGGALAVLLGIAALGWITVPLGVALFVFEVCLVAGLQAFIFATLTAIYLGGAVAESH